jgi:hypothetical protein
MAKTDYEQALINDIRATLLKEKLSGTKATSGTAKAVDVFGRTKEQAENLLLHHMGKKGITVKK